MRHLAARTVFLIAVPLSIYLFWFHVHFSLISDAGTATGYMTPEFQASLRGIEIPDTHEEIAIGSKVYIRHDGTNGGFLHSHKSYYLTGSKQQQVTCYAFRDENSVFQILPPLVENNGTMNVQPWTGFQRVKHGDVIRLEHVPTQKRLHSHDIRAPVTEKKTHNEVSCYGDNSIEGFHGDTNDHWRVEIESSMPAFPYLNAINTKFRLVHANTGCQLFSHDTKLPDWAFKQQEVTCSTNGRKELTLWRIEYNEHENMPKNASIVNYKKLTFTQMVWELHKVMWKINNDLGSGHPFASRPMSWILLKRGISYWGAGKGQGNGRVYLLGNPLIYLVALVSILAFIGYVVVQTVLEQRSIDWKGPGNLYCLNV
jgi:dolichyl-phosphate-mannose-protein mannosyltransferase